MTLVSAGALLGLAVAGTAIVAGGIAPPADAAKNEAAVPAAPEVAPSIAPQAFCDELVRAAKKQCDGGEKMQAERKALAEERSRLEKMASDIAQAREALQTETARLESLVRATDGMHGAAPAGEKQPAGKDQTKEDANGRRTAAAKSPIAAHVDMVAKSMRGMKPEQAAAVMKKLNRVLAARVLAEMRPADASAVLGKLEPAEAAELLTEAARGEPEP